MLVYIFIYILHISILIFVEFIQLWYIIKTDISVVINYNKLHLFRQYMLHVSVVLTVLRYLNTQLYNSKSNVYIYIYLICEISHIIQFMISYRVCINYRSISLSRNCSRKCGKIVKFVSITHSERSIWNGPIVATAISRKKRKSGQWVGRAAATESTFCTWPPRSPDLTVCDFFLCAFVKDSVYAPPLPETLPELLERISAAIGSVTQDMPEKVWLEWQYRRVTRGAHIE